MSRGQRVGTVGTQRIALTGRRILAQSKERARWEVSLPLLGSESQGQCVPSRRGLGTVQGLRLQI